MTQITEVREIADELVEAFERLMPQLSMTSAPPKADWLQQMLDSGTSLLFIARNDDGTIVGSATLVLVYLPSGPRGRVEDVVVDENARNRGIGGLLTDACIDRARDFGAISVDLTTHPKRGSANRLYEKAGFELFETNAYRYWLSATQQEEPPPVDQIKE